MRYRKTEPQPSTAQAYSMHHSGEIIKKKLFQYKLQYPFQSNSSPPDSSLRSTHPLCQRPTFRITRSRRCPKTILPIPHWPPVSSTCRLSTPKTRKPHNNTQPSQLTQPPYQRKPSPHRCPSSTRPTRTCAPTITRRPFGASSASS